MGQPSCRNLHQRKARPNRFELFTPHSQADVIRPFRVVAVEKVLNCSAANFLPKDETRDDCSSRCPQTSCRSHWRVYRFMMLPPHSCTTAAPTARKICVQRCKKTFSTASTRTGHSVWGRLLC